MHRLKLLFGLVTSLSTLSVLSAEDNTLPSPAKVNHANQPNTEPTSEDIDLICLTVRRLGAAELGFRAPTPPTQEMARNIFLCYLDGKSLDESHGDQAMIREKNAREKLSLQLSALDTQIRSAMGHQNQTSESDVEGFLSSFDTNLADADIEKLAELLTQRFRIADQLARLSPESIAATKLEGGLRFRLASLKHTKHAFEKLMLNLNIDGETRSQLEHWISHLPGTIEKLESDLAEESARRNQAALSPFLPLVN